MENFLIIAPMGLEETVCKEIRIKHPELCSSIELLLPKIGEGMVELVGPMELITLNQTLRTPTRILLRLGSWKCRDFPKLFRILRKFNWRPYLRTNQINFEVSTKKSRLIHSGRVQKTASDALTEYLKANAISRQILEQNRNKSQSIYLRIFEDELTVSLDTSGDLLHQRGDRTFRGKAALRENLASALILETLEGLPENEYELIDPMCGSGTFLTEAANIWRANDKRNFAYQLFTTIDTSRISVGTHLTDIHGFDHDPTIVKQSPNLPISLGELFNDHPIATADNRLVITNPPYGKRIKIPGKKILYYKNIISVVFKKFSPLRFGIIIPSEVDISSLLEIDGLVLKKKLRFFNSGIWVHYLIYEKSR